MTNKRRIFFPFLNSIILSTLLFFCSVSFAWSQKHFDFNENCQNAYEAIISLNFIEGKQWLIQEQLENPNNLIPLLIENYIDCLPILFNGNPSEYEATKSRITNRLKLIDQGPENSPWYLYSKASINFQWAASQIRMGDLTKGGRDFRRSYLFISENAQKFPSFAPNQILIGLEEAILGTVPDNYQWLAKLLGFKGNLKGGIAKLKTIAQSPKYQYLRDDAIFYYAYLDFYLGKNRTEVWRFIDRQNLDLKNHLLFTYMAANFALDDYQSKKAETILRNRVQTAHHLKVHFFDYLLGLAYVNNIDDRCVHSFQQFISQYEGKVFIKSSYQKLSLYYLAKNQRNKAIQEKQNILVYGNAQFDADKQAERFAKKSNLPNPYIIQSRLRNDGGYTQDALKALGNIRISQLNHQTDLLEYYYRYGSIYRRLENKHAAIAFFKKCIEEGKNSQEQFAARSAVELGEIYEEEKNYHLAKQYFNICLAMKNHDFQTAIDQRAKSGLARLP